MKIVTLAVAALLLVLPIGAVSAADPTLSDADRTFIETAHQVDLEEVAASHLAMRKATTAHVKLFAKEMLVDHIASHDRLQAFAKQLGVAMDRNMDDAHADKVKALENLQGAEFDRQYVSDEISDHMIAIAAFEKASSESTNAAIKSMAEGRLPMLRKNLDGAQKMLAKLGSS